MIDVNSSTELMLSVSNKASLSIKERENMRD